MAESATTGPFYPVDRVLSSRPGYDQQEYLLRWQGYGPEFDSWEPESHLIPGAKELLEEFQCRSRRPGGSSSSEDDRAGRTRTPRKQTSRFASPLSSPTPPLTPLGDKRFPGQQSAKRKRSPARSRPAAKRRAAESGAGVFFSDDETDGVDATAGAVKHAEKRRFSESRVPVAKMVKRTLGTIVATASPRTKGLRLQQPAESSPDKSLPLRMPPSLLASSVSGSQDFTDGAPETDDYALPEEAVPLVITKSVLPADPASAGRATSMSEFMRRAFGIFLVAYLVIIFVLAFSVPSASDSFSTG